MSKKIKKYFKVLVTPHSLMAAFLRRTKLPYLLSDKMTVRLWYWATFGRKLNLDNPQLFSEKLQWLKLYNRRPEYTTWVDKVAVKDYVANRIGVEHIIPTIGVWTSIDEIDWSQLPNQFVLKTTQGSGGSGVYVCKDKNQLDVHRVRHIVNHSTGKDDYRLLCEWPYRDVPRRILVEQYLEDKSGELRDYKFFCFNGKVKLFKIDFNRMVDHHANYYNCQAELQPFGEVAYWPDSNAQVEIPDQLDKMIKLAEKLADGQPFLRVDFYYVNGQIYFGELTFFPASGLSRWTTSDADALLGSWMDILTLKKC